MQSKPRPFSAFNGVFLATVGLGILTVAVPRSASAEDIYFVGYQYGPPGGSAGGWRNEASWFHDDQWFNFVVPTVSDTAIFDTGFDPQENGIPQIVHFGDSTVSTEPPYIPSPIPFPGGVATVNRLEIRKGDFTFQLASDPARGSLNVVDWIDIGPVDDHPQDSANLTVQGGTVKSSSVFVGTSGKGGLTVQAGGRLEAVPFIGSLNNGDGTLIVKDGGTVGSDFHAFIGYDRGSKGSVIVQAGGRLTVPDYGVYVGLGGNGSLVVKDGGIVEASVRGNDGVGIGTQSGSEGSVIVQTGGRLTTNALNVGLAGDGTLVVEDGGIAESGYGRVARLAGSTGEATVQGDGSRWDVTDTMFVGGHADTGVGGTGLLTVRDGGAVSIGSSLTTWRVGTVDVIVNGRILIGEGQIDDVAQSTILVGSGGTLAGDGTIIGDVVLNGGSLSPGHSPGLLTIDGDLRLGSNSVLDIEIGGLLGGSLYDQLAVTGDATFDGQLHISFIDGFIPSLGDAFDLINVAGLSTGAFSAIEFSGLGSIYPLTTGFEDGVFRLYVGDAPSAVPEPGSVALMGCGFLGLLGYGLKRRKASA